MANFKQSYMVTNLSEKNGLWQWFQSVDLSWLQHSLPYMKEQRDLYYNFKKCSVTMGNSACQG